MAKKRRKKTATSTRVTVSKGLLAKATAALAAVKRTVKAAPARKARKKTRRKSR